MASQDEAPTLDELRRELEAVGMVVVPFRDEIHIRRSMLEYIKVRVDDGVLRSIPYVGLTSQAVGTWLLLIVEAIAIPAALKSGINAQSISLGFLGTIAFGFQALRYTLAEVAISRVQSLWVDLRARRRVAGVGSAAQLGATTQALLAETARGHEPSSTAQRTSASRQHGAG